MITPVQQTSPPAVVKALDEIKSDVPNQNGVAGNSFTQITTNSKEQNNQNQTSVNNQQAIAINTSKDTPQGKKADFNDLAKKIRDIIGDNKYNVEFSFDKESKQFIMKVIDAKTQEIVRQVPPDETRRIAKMVSSIVDNGNVTDAKV